MPTPSSVSRAEPDRPARLPLGPLGYGAAALGNLYSARPDDVWPGIVPAAWEAGIRYFDTAPHYGLGLSERRLGESLRGLPRDQHILSTKVGRLLEPNPDYRPGDTDLPNLFDTPATSRRRVDYSRDGILRSVEESLIRLGVDRIDVLFVHDPDDHEREALDTAFPALDELRSQGIIRAYGAGMNQSAMLARFVRETDLDVVMCAGRYTLLDDSAARDLLPAAEERGVQVVVAAVFNSGLLATDRPRPGAHFDYAQPPQSLVARTNRIADVAGEYGVTVPQLALQFPLRHPAVTTVVTGADTAAQIAANAQLMEKPIPTALWSRLIEEGLIPAAGDNRK
ncbi:aldo/keto reductase [Leifsonia sp. 22587]|uniref:aldo/keto reductase n=1 Tax=Leifsonia sp. 22587 TaxID=3453946 RepID=UPI003F87259F